MKQKCQHCYCIINYLTNKIQCCRCGGALNIIKYCKLSEVYKLLKARPFSNECIENPDLYDAYCLRIIETLKDMQ